MECLACVPCCKGDQVGRCLMAAQEILKTKDQIPVELFISDLSLQKQPRQRTEVRTVPGTHRKLSVHPSSHDCHCS